MTLNSESGYSVPELEPALPANEGEFSSSSVIFSLASYGQLLKRPGGVYQSGP